MPKFHFLYRENPELATATSVNIDAESMAQACLMFNLAHPGKTPIYSADLSQFHNLVDTSKSLTASEAVETFKNS